jgi:ribonuclease PH
LVNPEGLRVDGRRPWEMRDMDFDVGGVPDADGSARVNMGNTRVLVTVLGPCEVSIWINIIDSLGEHKIFSRKMFD